MDEFDVFLNHRGPDVKIGFGTHLYNALKSISLNPFLDKKSLVKGNSAYGSINAALGMAKIHVAIVSRGYAESKYCLNELVTMMKSRKPVIPIFYGVEPTELRWMEKGPFAKAFEKHKLRETTKRLEEWTNALHNLADITGFCLSDYKGNEERLKQEVVDAILNFIRTKEALQVERHRIGLEEHINTCINKLEKTSHSIGFLGLVGMGGIGKTTLAKEIYNHFVGLKKFEAMSIVEIDHKSLSSFEVGPSLLKKLQNQILWDLMRIPDTNQQSYKHWFDKLSSRGPILIILDDVYDKAQFDELILNTSILAPGSCIIITSRDQHLLKVIAGNSNFYLHEVTPLEIDDSQKLFNLHAFGDEEAPENFKALAHEVIKACNGLPLALKVMGSSLFDKRSDEDLECIWPEAVDALKEDLGNVTNALRWSYTCLSESEKMMFVDIACIFYGWKKQEVLELWKSCKECSSCCGYKTPHTSLMHLFERSLVVISRDCDGNQVLTMHGLLQDMGKNIGEFNGSHLWDDNAIRVLEEKNMDLKKVRSLNFSNSQKHKFDAKNFAKLPNLHFLILDSCDVSGNLISKELRWLQWRCMPMTQLPPMLNLSNLVSLDFSQSTKLANASSQLDPNLEACPNLLRFNLNGCTSIKTLPDSIGRLSKLQVLELKSCTSLEKFPNSIGQLIALEELYLFRCESLKSFPNTITTLSKLRWLHMDRCPSISKLPTTFGKMTSLTSLYINLSTKFQAMDIGKLNALKELGITECTDEAINVLDDSKVLKNLAQLSKFNSYKCKSMTKLPHTIGLLTNLNLLTLWGCEKLKDLPSSIGELKMLKTLSLTKCNNLQTLPNSINALKKLQHLHIVQCTSFTKFPTSIAQLTSLRTLKIEGSGELQSLPDSLRQLSSIVEFTILDCGSLEELGALKALQGFRIWGCTSITKLPGSCLMVLDKDFCNLALFIDYEENCRQIVRRNLKDLGLVEKNDCGFLRHVYDIEGRRSILQRVHKLTCSNLTPN